MTFNPAILNTLADTRNHAAVTVLESALQVETDNVAQEALCEVLVRRGERSALTVMVRLFHMLGAGGRTILLSQAPHLFGPLCDALKNATGPDRANAIQVARELHDPRYAFVFEETLKDSRAPVRQAAADALVELVDARDVPGGTTAPTIAHSVASAAPSEFTAAATGPDGLRRALLGAIRTFDKHEQSKVLLAAMRFDPRTRSALWQAIDQFGPAITRAAAETLRPDASAEVGETCLLALATGLRAAATAAIANARPALARGVLDGSFRLFDPALRKAAETTSAESVMAQTNGSPIARLCIIRWLNIGSAGRVVGAATVAGAADHSADALCAKMLAARELATFAWSDSTKGLSLLASDPDVRVARIAARALLNRPHREVRQSLLTLKASAHRDIARLAAAKQAVLNGPADFDHSSRCATISDPSARDGSSVDSTAAAEASIPRMLGSGRQADIARGLSLLSQSSDLLRHKAAIVNLCAHENPEIVTAAIRLLGKLRDRKCMGLLRIAARHPDPQVSLAATAILQSFPRRRQNSAPPETGPGGGPTSAATGNGIESKNANVAMLATAFDGR